MARTQEHDVWFDHDTKRWHCRRCQWDWAAEPRSHCPRIPRYTWVTHPDTMQTKTEWGRRGRKLTQGAKHAGCVQILGNDYRYFYDIADTVEIVRRKPKS